MANKSKEMIKGLLQSYDAIKDKSIVGSGKGVPRGIGISSPLSELYMADLDKEIKGRREVIFFSRYVDDIFIVLSDLAGQQSIEAYYHQLEGQYKSRGLSLQAIGSDKCQLIGNLFKESSGVNPNTADLTYLGYHLYISREKRKMQAIFGLSGRRKDKIKQRIDHTFDRFGHVVKVDARQAKRDLRDGLNLITGNIRLNNAKSSVKVGFYYNNDLLDREEDFNELNQYLQSKTLPIPANLFGNTTDRENFERKVKSYISSISFKKRWEERKMYDISPERLKEIEKWL